MVSRHVFFSSPIKASNFKLAAFINYRILPFRLDKSPKDMTVKLVDYFRKTGHL